MEVLLEKTVHLSTKHDKTNVILPFTVPHDFARLEISIAYSPKYITDPEDVKKAVMDCYRKYLLPEDVPETVDPSQFRLNNLLTLSLDCNGRYVGAAHRQAPLQFHVISKEKSSRGFWKCKVEKGEWRAMINVHSLAAGTVDYEIQIVGWEDGEE